MNKMTSKKSYDLFLKLIFWKTQIVLIVLKIIGKSSLSWIMTFSPIIILLFLIIIFAVLYIIVSDDK
jgi:hypothetical protein